MKRVTKQSVKSMYRKKRILEEVYTIKEGKKEFSFSSNDISYWHSLEDLKRYASPYFKLVRTYGDYTGAEFNSNFSRRMITAWEKA